MGYLANLLNALYGLGESLDKSEDAVLDGPASETISIRCAKAAVAGKRWGCFACWALNWLVQHNHCNRMLHGYAIPHRDVIRAAIWLTIWLWFPISWYFLGVFWALYLLAFAFFGSVFVTLFEIG